MIKLPLGFWLATLNGLFKFDRRLSKELTDILSELPVRSKGPAGFHAGDPIARGLKVLVCHVAVLLAVQPKSCA